MSRILEQGGEEGQYVVSLGWWGQRGEAGLYWGNKGVTPPLRPCVLFFAYAALYNNISSIFYVERTIDLSMKSSTWNPCSGLVRTPALSRTLLFGIYFSGVVNARGTHTSRCRVLLSKEFRHNQKRKSRSKARPETMSVVMKIGPNWLTDLDIFLSITPILFDEGNILRPAVLFRVKLPHEGR